MQLLVNCCQCQPVELFATLFDTVPNFFLFVDTEECRIAQLTQFRGAHRIVAVVTVIMITASFHAAAVAVGLRKLRSFVPLERRPLQSLLQTSITLRRRRVNSAATACRGHNHGVSKVVLGFGYLCFVKKQSDSATK